MTGGLLLMVFGSLLVAQVTGGKALQRLGWIS